MRNLWIVSILMAVFALDYILMTTGSGTYYKAVYLSNVKQEKEQEILYHVQKYLHRCSIKSNCNFVVEDKKNRVKLYHSRSEIPIEEKLLGVWMKMRRQHSYRVVEEALSWKDARSTCQLHGWELASITNKQEEEKIKHLLSGYTSNKFYWFGLNDIGEEGKYVWSDGSEYSYSSWEEGQPNNLKNQDCMCMKQSMLWYDCTCGDKGYFICQKLVQ